MKSGRREDDECEREREREREQMTREKSVNSVLYLMEVTYYILYTIFILC